MDQFTALLVVIHGGGFNRIGTIGTVEDAKRMIEGVMPMFLAAVDAKM